MRLARARVNNRSVDKCRRRCKVSNITPGPCLVRQTTQWRRTSKMTHLSRRRFLGTATAAAAAGAVGSPKLTEMLSAKAAPAVLQEKAKLTYWGGLIFSDDANNLLVDTINQWGEDNNVDTEVVM